MSAAPLVSIVTPFFKAEAFLAQTINSVQAQSFKDWELLLIDNASPDRSGEIAAAVPPATMRSAMPALMCRKDSPIEWAEEAHAETAAKYEYLNLGVHEIGEGLSADEIRLICKTFNVPQTIF